MGAILIKFGLAPATMVRFFMLKFIKPKTAILPFVSRGNR